MSEAVNRSQRVGVALSNWKRNWKENSQNGKFSKKNNSIDFSNLGLLCVGFDEGLLLGRHPLARGSTTPVRPPVVYIPSNIRMITLEDMFVRIEPFRREILSLLQPFEISKLSRATRCKLSEWEEKTYMNILDDIFEDPSIISHMIEAGMTVRILGSDIKRLQMRLKHPPAYPTSSTPEYHLFVLVSDQSMGSANTATLVRDYRRASEQGFVPDDLSLVELHARFDSSIATQIASFSRWILCAPYLAGTMPDMVPGWIPFLSTRPQIHVRTYISTYNDCNGKILHMNRSLTRQLFGIETNKCILAEPSNLSTYCLKMNGSGTIAERLKGNFTISFLHNLLEETQRQGEVQFVIVNTLYSSNCSITISLQ